MLTSLLLAAQLAAAPIDCDARSGWNAGRAGQPVPEACHGDDYLEAHRLGESLKQLQDEHARIEAELPTLAPPAQASARRRQRQLDLDLEAIRGLATIKAWPLDPVPASLP